MKKEDNNFYERSKQLEKDIIDCFKNIIIKEKLILTTKETLEDGWPNTYILIDGFSGDNIDCYPLSVNSKGFITIIKENGEQMNGINFEDFVLFSQIELLDLIKEVSTSK
jgi:hypothetical protein